MLAGKRILIVDDHSDSRELVRHVLEGAGLRVYDADSAAEALACLDDTTVDLIISDISMPDRDGCALVRDIRGRRDTSAVPAVALSAGHDSTEALQAGFDVYIRKPFRPKELLQIVGEFLT